LEGIIKKDDTSKIASLYKGKKIMIEYAHPNTHKELHIGHLRTLILGESLSRIFEAVGARVFRVNYQGDIGPHVAKSIWGTEKILKAKGLSIEKVDSKYSLIEKAKLLGEGYVKGVGEYEDNKDEIDAINNKIYQKDEKIDAVYQKTRQWSLDYYDLFYKQFATKFDRFYFESEVYEKGKSIVLDNIGKVFEKSEGAIIFDGEKYGLHKRVFITKDGNPTYEAKDMALAPLQLGDFAFDQNIHVVANEQKGYFEVVFKALEIIDPKLKGREFHLSMGMVNLVGKKISSRKGEIQRVNELTDKVKQKLSPLINEKIEKDEKDKVAEKTTIGAIKYSILKVNPKMDVLFDIEKSINFQGNSGPYLQYTHARCKSVIRKLKTKEIVKKVNKINKEEEKILRSFSQYEGVIIDAAKYYSPGIICNYLHDMAQKYNNFYNSNRIIGDEKESFRILVTIACSKILKDGLNLLGIEAPERM